VEGEYVDVFDFFPNVRSIHNVLEYHVELSPGSSHGNLKTGRDLGRSTAVLPVGRSCPVRGKSRRGSLDNRPTRPFGSSRPNQLSSFQANAKRTHADYTSESSVV